MAENMKLNDDQMEQATGGISRNVRASATIVERVKSGYVVRLDNGQEVLVKYDGAQEFAHGTTVEVQMVDGQWAMTIK